MRILIVEDDNSIATPLQKALEKVGYAVDNESTGEAGLKTAQINSYDCILLDLNLPQLDGIDVANQLREQEIDTPILMVTARTQIPNKLQGFNAGADDYITKPFDLQELLARINAVIKRNSSNKETFLNFGKYTLDPSSSRVTGPQELEILLTNKESAVLEYLIRNKGKYISAEELLEHVWDREIDIFSDTVRTHIKTLRNKIDPKKKYIISQRGKGYAIQD